MDGTTDKKLELLPDGGTSVETIEPLTIIPDADKEDSVVTEDVPAIEETARAKPSKIIKRSLCAVLALTGTAAYGYLGYGAVAHLKNGGFRELVAAGVFGGAVVSVSPMTSDTSESVYPEAEMPTDEYLAISSENIGCTDPDAVFNETEYDLEYESVEASAVPKYATGNKVLIIHTHGTEGYAPEGDVPLNEDFRTNDSGESVVAVGSAFAEILQSRGIETLHCTEMFDAESYIDAYSRSGAAVAEYTKDDPDIAYVIDIHRDAVIRENGTVVRSDNGGAQLMIVCGTDEMGADFSDWRENFAFGKAYQHMLYDTAPELVRHMNLRSASFNQQLADRSLLLEVGTCGNTLAEAVDSAKIAAEAFADLILSK